LSDIEVKQVQGSNPLHLIVRAKGI
jgi:hypothetical protein